jgi:elongation factor P
MALEATDLKKGAVFTLDGTPYRVLDYTQKVMGRGGSQVTVKIKSLLDGKIIERSIKAGDNIDSADLITKPMQFLYEDGQYHFMDTGNYEQFALAKDDVGDQAKYMKEGDEVSAQLFEGRVISVELPKNLPLKVTYTEDAVRGDTSSSITKDATLESGAVVKVPAFIKTGDVISVDTTTGNYRERIKS